MQITFAAPSLKGPGALVVAAFEDGLSPLAAEVHKATGGALKRAMQTNRFKGKASQVLDLLAPAGLAASRVLLLGFGKQSAFDGRAAEKAAPMLG